MSHRGETLTFERIKKELETELKKNDNNMSKWNLQQYVKSAEEQNKSAEQQQEKNVFGAMLGDEVEVGCGTVLNPGSVVGKNTNIYPLSSVRGYVPCGSIYKKQGEVVTSNV